MIYINKTELLNEQFCWLEIPTALSKHYGNLSLTLLNAQSKECFIAHDLYDSSLSEYFVLIGFQSEEINKLQNGYYNYIVRDSENYLISCGLLEIFEDKPLSKQYNDREQTHVVYQG